jgi:hypothetical protein
MQRQILNSLIYRRKDRNRGELSFVPTNEFWGYWRVHLIIVSSEADGTSISLHNVRRKRP